jgi:succinate dehydrogenase flavin-adding protein (antitoxin of CptAB toxin-antitoxin module)
MNLKLQVEDPIVLKVMSKFYDRSQRGIEKYGTMLTRTDLDFIDWVTHLQEELMDATLYIEKLKADLKQAQKDAIIQLMNSEYDEMLNEEKDKG